MNVSVNSIFTLHLPELSPSAQADLNVDITLEEVKQAIRSFSNGKAAVTLRCLLKFSQTD